MKESTLIVNITDGIMSVRLNRPEVHNAFNDEMLRELTTVFSEIPEEVVAVVLSGEGKSFCSGVDLQWMKAVSENSYEKNYEESLMLSECFYKIYTCPKPTIAKVHGVALGGANGLLSACDIAICTDDAVFSLSEVKIGIVPACISPYVIKRTGEYGARELMLTGRRINGRDAEKYRLVNNSYPADQIDQELQTILSHLKTSGPEAMKHCKTLISEVSNNLSLLESYDFTAKMIADIRASEEGQEGMNAFLEKRKPSWIK